MHMKHVLLLLCFFSQLAQAQKTPWQQQVNYSIKAALNDRDHTLSGKAEIEYVNASPDVLPFVWVHLWPNAYRNENTAYARQIFRDKDGKARWKKMKDRGGIDSLDFTVNGQKAKMEAHPEHIDIVKVILPQPLQPGAKATIRTPFFVKIPTYGSRSGHDGQSYMMCQWYPKVAVYDQKGWHPMPYLDQGEFYNEFGDYEVAITLPSSYIVGATGVLQNEAERQQYMAIGRQNVAQASRVNTVKYEPAAGATKTLVYKAERVPDFAWFADKNYVIRYDTLQLDAGRTVDVYTFHHPDGNANWVNSIGYVKTGTRHYSENLGTYPYPTVQAVEGPKNDMSGGMEYPMITLITSPDATEEMLDAVITHEVGHNWLCILLASNERQHAWMDEGINTYYQFRYEAEKYRYNSIFGSAIPVELRQKSAPEFQSIVYRVINEQIPMKTPIDIPSTDFKNKEEYGLITYIKTAVWMHYLEQEFGREKLDRAMRAYFNEWKFRHPYPEDLKAVLERELKADLTNYFDLLKKQGSL
jgi:hypothetical protein